MSFKSASASLVTGKTLKRDVTVGATSGLSDWIRNPLWLQMTAPLPSDEKFVGLHAVYADSNFLALSATGAYIVDWGDGTPIEVIASGVQANHQYDFNATSLAGTDGADESLPYKQAIVTVTPQIAGTLTSVNLHKLHNQAGLNAYSSGFLDIAIAGQFLTDFRVAVATPGVATQVITFSNLEQINVVKSNIKNLEYLFYSCRSLKSVVGLAISADPSISIAVSFSAASATATSAGHGMVNGDVVFLTSIVGTIGLTTGVRYFVTNSTTNTFQLSATYGGAVVGLAINGTGVFQAGSSLFNAFASCSTMQTMAVTDTNNVVSFSGMFANCTCLKLSPILNTAKGLNLSSMFSGCSSLQTVPLLSTDSSTNLSNLFYGCSSLQTVPSLNTSQNTNFASMFSGCASLQTIPLLNTRFGTTFSGMFSGCSSLKSIPLIDTGAGTTFSSMFNGCQSLQTIPLINTSAGLTMTGMFSGCASLRLVPILNTCLNTNFISMFSGCVSLRSVPLFNTIAGTNFTSMFIGCSSLQAIPLLNTIAGTNFTSMFSGCISLQSAPLLNTSSGASLSAMFSGCTQLATAATAGAKSAISYVSCKLSKSSIESIFDNLGKSTSSTITISSNWGAQGAVSLSATTTVKSTTVTMASTAGVSVGMQVVGAGISVTTPVAVSLTDLGDVVSLTGHGLSDGDDVSFATITTTAGIATYTPYFVLASTANTFQLSRTADGAAIALTTNGTGSIMYSTLVAAVTATTVVLNKPATLSGATTLVFRMLATRKALLKGWLVVG